MKTQLERILELQTAVSNLQAEIQESRRAESARKAAETERALREAAQLLSAIRAARNA